MNALEVKQITRNLWHVLVDDRVLGAIRCIRGAPFQYQAQPHGAPESSWTMHDAPDGAARTLQDYAAAQSPATEETQGSRFAHLEVD